MSTSDSDSEVLHPAVACTKSICIRPALLPNVRHKQYVSARSWNLQSQSQASALLTQYQAFLDALDATLVPQPSQSTPHLSVSSLVLSVYEREWNVSEANTPAGIAARVEGGKLKNTYNDLLAVLAPLYANGSLTQAINPADDYGEGQYSD